MYSMRHAEHLLSPDYLYPLHISSGLCKGLAQDIIGLKSKNTKKKDASAPNWIPQSGQRMTLESLLLKKCKCKV